MMADKPTIGRIVHYQAPRGYGGLGGDFHLAAIVTMTPEEWTPGYRDDGGEWHETTGVSQPKAGCVHLHVFSLPITPGTPPMTIQDVADVPYGEPGEAVVATPGFWYWPPKV